MEKIAQEVKRVRSEYPEAEVELWTMDKQTLVPTLANATASRSRRT